MKSIIANEDGTYVIDGEIYVKKITSMASAESPTKEAVFAELVKDLVRKEDRVKYPDSVFWFNKAGQFMFEYDEKTRDFWCSHARVWSVFETKFGMNYDEIQKFTKGMVEQHFNCNDVITKKVWATKKL